MPVLSKGSCHYPVRMLQRRRVLEDSDSHSSLADHIQTKWSISQLKTNRGGFMEDLAYDCRTLKELLQVSMHVQPMKDN